ncbi:transcriptional repressor [Iodidimonas muriae]|uniref:Transcriptional repressor n=1 Tax=Iodidimonas muriae TaxID=261467 RepID=A0ABQ2L5H7_9PROT|nr:transcriptional repressor [Iodidimonas muriae]GER06297.1 transcriptional repressor [Kordiimonadales bacterium JCM 17843]GGO04197.1 transcriptional repressor [Iodidimonas muriae]
MPLMPAKPEYPHDHAQCSSDALAEAQRICARRGVRLTETRQKVLELIWGDHAAVKAYDLLEQLSGPGRAVRPPTIYRALDFLLENGLIHRIESLNAYVGCPQPGGQHSSQFLICDACSIVIELTGTDVVHAVADEAASHGFEITRQTIEVHGLCGPCAARHAEEAPVP